MNSDRHDSLPFPPRPVTRSARGVEASDGAGVRLTRIISSPEIGILDPFLLLDEFGSDRPEDYLAGFPDHPHRGFDTVTYMLRGRMRHADNNGHSGVIDSGGVQWMRAGRGIVHSEMPERDQGEMRGFQLWVNLPSRLKMTAPGYQEFSAGQIPVETREGGCTVKVIAGRTARGTAGAVADIPTAPLYCHVLLEQGGRFEEAFDERANACIYVEQGAIDVVPADGTTRTVSAGELAVLGDGGGVSIRNRDRPSGLLLLAARPLGEPIAWSGPFVMNTREELALAFDDYRHGRF